MGLYFNAKIPTTNLQCLLDASNPKSYNGGNAWNDISGNNRNFSWVSSPTYTSNGGQSYFSTLNNLCRGPASNSFGISNSSGYTIIMVAKTISPNSNAAFKFSSSNSSTGSANRGIFLHPSWTNWTYYYDQGGCCNADQRTQYTYGQSVLQQWNVFCLRSTVATRSIIRNGIETIRNNTTAANINLDSVQCSVGGAYNEYGNNSSLWDGHLAYFSVYNTGLSDKEINEITFSLKGRFGI